MNKFSVLAFLFVMGLVSCTNKKPADLVITGGKIYTVNDAQPVVEAVVVHADTIVFVGSEKEAREWVGENTKVIDLKGNTLIPGFIEGHGHFMGVGYGELDLDLSGIANFDELVEKVRVAASKAKPGQWILGRGWHQDKWDKKPTDMVKGFPSHMQLSKVSPDNPVFLSHASGHMSLANAKAMEIAGVNLLSIEGLNKVNEEGGEIVRDKNGNPTGLFNENAENAILKFIPANDQDRITQAFELATKACQRNGITSFHDAGVDRDIIDFYKKQNEQNNLGVRMYVMITGWNRDLVHEWIKSGPEIDPAHWLTIRSIKLNCDGALGSRGAWLLEPYSDQLNSYGMTTLSMDTVLSTSREALKAGFQVCSHAIGDRANREILDRYEMALKENPGVKDSRFRIEHAQHIDPADIPRFASLGVIPAMQAIHMSSDRPWAIERLGEKRIKEGAYMWQSLLKSGAKIVNGTDAPVEPVNPIPSFYASVTRMTLKGEPEGGYEPEEKMTREQALRSYTLDAAYGAFEEKFKGSIEPGKLADFVILSKDITTVPEKEILSTNVVTTIVGGKVVFEQK
jgi:predicted amidohydrolase YtcJ